jgi:hypothetical protein
LGYRFRESLFFLPVLIVLAGLGLALVVGDLNRWLQADAWPLATALRLGGPSRSLSRSGREGRRRRDDLR